MSLQLPLSREYAKFSEVKFRSFLRCFALDMTATQTAQMTGIFLRSTNQIFLRLREHLAQVCEKNSPFAGELEADESYFGRVGFGAVEVVAPSARPSFSG
jgi:hypothetical protein